MSPANACVRRYITINRHALATHCKLTEYNYIFVQSVLTFQTQHRSVRKLAVVSAPSTIDGVQQYKRRIPEVLQDFHFDVYGMAMNKLFNYHYYVQFEMLWRLAVEEKPSETVIVNPCDCDEPAAAPRPPPVARHEGRGGAPREWSGRRQAKADDRNETDRRRGADDRQGTSGRRGYS